MSQIFGYDWFFNWGCYIFKKWTNLDNKVKKTWVVQLEPIGASVFQKTLDIASFLQLDSETCVLLYLK